jgi:hypothetical protein
MGLIADNYTIQTVIPATLLLLSVCYLLRLVGTRNYSGNN